MDSLWLVPLSHAHEKTMGQKTVGRYLYALIHVQSVSDEPWARRKLPSTCGRPLYTYTEKDFSYTPTPLIGNNSANRL